MTRKKIFILLSTRFHRVVPSTHSKHQLLESAGIFNTVIVCLFDWFCSSSHLTPLMQTSEPQQCKWKSEMFTAVHILPKCCWTSECWFPCILFYYIFHSAQINSENRNEKTFLLVQLMWFRGVHLCVFAAKILIGCWTIEEDCCWPPAQRTVWCVCFMCHQKQKTCRCWKDTLEAFGQCCSVRTEICW